MMRESFRRKRGGLSMEREEVEVRLPREVYEFCERPEILAT